VAKKKIPIEISVVAPAYNESEVISEFVRELTKVMKSLKVSFEIIVVDDGSSDETLEQLKQAKIYARELRIISLGRNIGHMRALELGMTRAIGRFVITMDADFQDDPRDLARLWQHSKELSKKQEAFDVIQTFRMNRKHDTLSKRLTAKLFYRFMKSLLGASVIENAADFRLLTWEATRFLLDSNSKNKVFRFMIPNSGLRVKYIEVIRNERRRGKTKYSFFKMLKLATDSVVHYSVFPLRIVFITAVTCSALSILMIPLLFWIKMTSRAIPGWVSLIVVEVSFGSVLLVCLAVNALYLARLLEQITQGEHIKCTEI